MNNFRRVMESYLPPAEQGQLTMPSILQIDNNNNNHNNGNARNIGDARKDEKKKTIPVVKSAPTMSQAQQIVEMYHDDNLKKMGQTPISVKNNASKTTAVKRGKKRSEYEDLAPEIKAVYHAAPIQSIIDNGNTSNSNTNDNANTNTNDNANTNANNNTNTNNDTNSSFIGGRRVVSRLEDYGVRGKRDSIFVKQIESAHRVPDEVLSRLPKMAEVMGYIKTMQDRPVWYVDFPALVVEKGLTHQAVEVLTPIYVSDFLYEPCNPWERLCVPPFNTQEDKFFTCESVLMGGAQLREFLLPTQERLLMESVRSPSVAGYAFPDLHRHCFLCFQRLVTSKFGQLKTPQNNQSTQQNAQHQNQNTQNQSIQNTEAQEDTLIIHDYVMAVGLPGLYDPKQLIPGIKKTPCGIAGPVILHDRLHYAPTQKIVAGKRIRGWRQLDAMLFRPGATSVQ